MLKAFINSVKVPEIRKRILFTLGIIAIVRLAANIPVPGIDPEGLKALFAELSKSSTASGVLGMVNIFSGGALQKFAIAALGIMPYISASIIIQLMTPVFPMLEKLQREGDSGRQKISQYTRYLTLVICVIQGWMLAAGMENPGQIGLPDISVVTTPGFAFKLTTIVIMMATTMILMWLGEQVTERGIGNGISIIITVNIISRLPQAAISLVTLATGSGEGESEFSLIYLVVTILFFVLITAMTVALSQGIRQIPLRYAARKAGATSSVGQTTYMPLKVNFSGVMPLIFAGAVLMFANIIVNFLAGLGNGQENVSGFTEFVSGIARSVASFIAYGSGGYMLIFATCIIIFTFFWVANQFNPIRIADDLKRGGAYVPGIRPGQPTADYIDHTMTYITVIGTLGLVILALIPIVITTEFKALAPAAQFLGGSSLLIMVGVLLDVVRQIEASLVARNYDGFLSKGKIKGRGSN